MLLSELNFVHTSVLFFILSAISWTVFYCFFVYLNLWSMTQIWNILPMWSGRSTSCNQDCQEKYQEPQICRWHHPYGRKWRGTKKPLDEGEKGEWKPDLKLNIQKTKIMASGPISSWQIDGETVKTVSDYLGGAPKSVQMVIAAMKLKDAYSLEGKLWPT